MGAGSNGSYAVVDRFDDHVVGLVSLAPRGTGTELSYEFFPGEWGKGLATEARSAVRSSKNTAPHRCSTQREPERVTA